MRNNVEPSNHISRNVNKQLEWLLTKGGYSLSGIAGRLNWEYTIDQIREFRKGQDNSKMASQIHLLFDEAVAKREERLTELKQRKMSTLSPRDKMISIERRKVIKSRLNRFRKLVRMFTAYEYEQKEMQKAAASMASN